ESPCARPVGLATRRVSRGVRRPARSVDRWPARGALSDFRPHPFGCRPMRGRRRASLFTYSTAWLQASGGRSDEPAKRIGSGRGARASTSCSKSGSARPRRAIVLYEDDVVLAGATITETVPAAA